MISPLAKSDLDDLRAEGLTPTDDDVVRLHALALRITDGPETTAANFPRFALAGGATFFELTIAAERWYSFARTFADDAATDGFMLAFASAHGREYRFLKNLTDAADIQRKLGEFIAGLTCTRAELERAMLWVLRGDDTEEAERTEIQKAADAAKGPTEAECEHYAAMQTVMAQALKETGLTLEEIMEQTPSRLQDMVLKANIKAGQKLTRNVALANAQYLATVAAIRKRLEGEAAAAKEKAAKEKERGENGER